MQRVVPKAPPKPTYSDVEPFLFNGVLFPRHAPDTKTIVEKEAQLNQSAALEQSALVPVRRRSQPFDEINVGGGVVQKGYPELMQFKAEMSPKPPEVTPEQFKAEMSPKPPEVFEFPNPYCEFPNPYLPEDTHLPEMDRSDSFDSLEWYLSQNSCANPWQMWCAMQGIDAAEWSEPWVDDSQLYPDQIWYPYWEAAEYN